MADPIMRGLQAMLGAAVPRVENAQTVAMANSVTPASLGLPPLDTTASGAMKLSAVSRCVDVLSGDIAKLPAYVYSKRTRERVEHPVTELLNMRANRIQTGYAARKTAMAGKLCGGNGCLLIERDSRSMRPVRLVGLPWSNVYGFLDTAGELWYEVIHPFTGKTLQHVNRMDMIHVPNNSRNGWWGISVLQVASEVIRGGLAAQQFNAAYYLNGGQPGGVLSTDENISGKVDVTDGEGNTTQKAIKDIIREEWEARHGGPDNANRIAVLDHGLKYQPISISQRDAQFVENAELTIRDLARFFGVPLYKLQEGKQSYNSNEQNAIEYVTATLHPHVSAWEQELTYKLLTPQERRDGLEIRLNMMAELRGDSTSRAAWYREMLTNGVYSVNDVLALEDMPDVEGGDEHAASLNYVPLRLWPELSINRNANGGNDNADSV